MHYKKLLMLTWLLACKLSFATEDLASERPEAQVPSAPAAAATVRDDALTAAVIAGGGGGSAGAGSSSSISRELMFFWGSGYWAKDDGSVNPVGGSVEECEKFFKDLTTLSASHPLIKVVLIATQDVWSASKGHVPEGMLLEVLILEELLQVFQKEGGDLEGFSPQTRRCLEKGRQVLGAPEFAKLSDEFTEYAGEFLKNFEHSLKDNSYVNFSIYRDDGDMLKDHISFMLSQALTGRGNPAFASDAMRFLYPILFAQSDLSHYMDIDTFSNVMSLDDGMSKVARVLEAPIITDSKYLFHAPRGRLDVIQQVRSSTTGDIDYIIGGMFLRSLRGDLFGQLFVAHYHSCTRAFLKAFTPGDVLKNVLEKRLYPYLNFISTYVHGAVPGRDDLVATNFALERTKFFNKTNPVTTERQSIYKFGTIFGNYFSTGKKEAEFDIPMVHSSTLESTLPKKLCFAYERVFRSNEWSEKPLSEMGYFQLFISYFYHDYKISGAASPYRLWLESQFSPGDLLVE